MSVGGGLATFPVGGIDFLPFAALYMLVDLNPISLIFELFPECAHGRRGHGGNFGVRLHRWTLPGGRARGRTHASTSSILVSIGNTVSTHCRVQTSAPQTVYLYTKPSQRHTGSVATWKTPASGDCWHNFAECLYNTRTRLYGPALNAL